MLLQDSHLRFAPLRISSRQVSRCGNEVLPCGLHPTKAAGRKKYTAQLFRLDATPTSGFALFCGITLLSSFLLPENMRMRHRIDSCLPCLFAHEDKDVLIVTLRSQCSTMSSWAGCGCVLRFSKSIAGNDKPTQSYLSLLKSLETAARGEVRYICMFACREVIEVHRGCSLC